MLAAALYLLSNPAQSTDFLSSFSSGVIIVGHTPSGRRPPPAKPLILQAGISARTEQR